MTSDPGPGSSGSPQPPPTPPSPGLPAFGPPAYGPPSYGPNSYGQPPAYGPYPYPPGPQGQFVQPTMRAAAADRERTMDVLKAAFTEGRLSKSEFDERSARVFASRTYADLNALVADLPVGAGGPALPLVYPAGYYPPVPAKTNGFAVGALICGMIPFFGGIPAVILGHVARGQIRQTGERGDGLA
ncbi:MAG TPA: DUF1707 and DUF4190 domain-containing protein, partial [Trebonia sp.]|nr:DUF1707 and DUF4190 domain-containing protein [Trebonia sp.]